MRRAYVRSWAVCLVCIALLPLIVIGLKQVRMKNDVESWLPENDPNALALSWFHDHFEHFDRFLVSWDSSSLEDPRVAKFVDAVRNVPGVHDATSPVEILERMDEKRIDRDVAVERLKGVLVGTGGMKVRLTETGRSRRDAIIKSINEAAQQEFGIEVRTDLPPADRESNYDFQVSFPGIGPDTPRTNAMLSLITQLGATTDQRAPIVDEVFFEPGAPVAISVAIEELEEQELGPMIAAVRDAAISVGVASNELRLGGSPVAGAELNHLVVRSVRNPDYPVWMIWKYSPIILSVAISVILAFVMLKSIRLAAIVLLVGTFCVLATVALVPATGGTMSMVLIVMPNLLMVLTMSGAIHLANYWKHAAGRPEADRTTESAEDSGEASIRQAVRQARGPCSMASFTTAIGLASLLTSLLNPVRDFGCYSAVGCGISLLMVILVVPALLRLWPGRAGKLPQADHTWWYSFGQAVVRHHKFVTTACVLVFVSCVIGFKDFKTETKVIRYFPTESRIIEDYNRLEQSLAGIVPVSVVVGFQGDGWSAADLQDQIDAIRTLEAALANHPEISGTISLAGFIPEPPDETASRSSRLLYNRKIAKAIRDAVEGETQETSFVARVHDSLVTTDRGRAVAFELPTPDQENEVSLGQEIWKITCQVSIVSEMDYNTFLSDVDVIVSKTLAEFEASQFPEASDDPRDVSYIVTGTVPLFLRTQQAVLESLIRSFALAFGVIALVMMFVLKGFRSGLITMLPNLLPVGVVFGAVSWMGIAVDIGTMITASVALGIAVDGTLHLITWFRERLAKGISPDVAIAEGLTHCGPAMWQTSSIVGIGMLALLGADLLLISRFGSLMAALIAAALVADLVFLPSLLAGPLGRLIASRVKPIESNTEEFTNSDLDDDSPSTIPFRESAG